MRVSGVAYPAIEAQSIDISIGGMSFVSDRSLEGGWICLLEFEVPTKVSVQAVRSAARVVDCVLSPGLNGFRTGATFVSPSAEFVTAVGDYVSSRVDGLWRNL